MSGFYLTKGKKEYYGEQFVDLNRRIDSFLRRILGNFHWEGPRNWFGSAEEGRWSRVGGSLDYYHVILGILFFTTILLTLISLWKQGATLIAISLLIYTVIGLFVIIFWSIAQINVKLPSEYMSAGNITTIRNYIKPVTLVILLWGAIYSLLGFLTSQSILPLPFQAVAPEFKIGLLTLSLLSVLIIPFVEASFFVGLGIPTTTKFFGIIPSIIIVSIARGVFHSIIFAGQPINIGMSILFGLMLYPIAMAYKSKEPAIEGHILANLIAFIFNLIFIS